MSESRYRLGILGARGWVGRELLLLVAANPHLELAYASSRELAGQLVSEVAPGSTPGVRFEDLGPEDAAAREADAVVLALPNDCSEPFVRACEARRPDVVLVDLSADHRFDDAWTYGLVEHHRDAIQGARRVANPGCYATGIQLAVRPLLAELTGEPRAFGVSGYSGAGTTPSPRNDPERLRDNLLPYALSGHLHEREVSRHLAHRVRFFPHVAAYFRGISLTLSMDLAAPMDLEAVRERYEEAYRGEPLVVIRGEIPEVRSIARHHHAEIGGFVVEGTRLAFVTTLDNLLKGAATQAMQNLNLALGLQELTGIEVHRTA
jgi:N-acetyl-gamma-glutamyl-phosphate reductase